MPDNKRSLPPKWQGRFCAGCGSRDEAHRCPDTNMLTAMQYIEYLERWQEDAADVLIAARNYRLTIPVRRIEVGSSLTLAIAAAVDRFTSRRVLHER